MANVISSAVAERDSSDNRHSVHGESLLLPLLQELLDKKCAHQQSQQLQQQQSLMNRSASSQSSEESQTATVDSGTESGEDLRFLAVGLCDSMVDASRSAGEAGGIEPLGPGLLAEVQHALSRLAMSLQVDSTDVDLEPGRKHSLLQLVARLQSSLVVPAKPPTERRSSTGRFARHKNRQNRHTVGVSSEEIAAARKLMQAVVLRDNMSVGATPDYAIIPPEYTTKEKPETYCLQKQNSDGCMGGTNNVASYRPVKNATAKPFSPTGFSYSSKQPTYAFKSISEPVTPNDFTREKVNLRQTSLNLEPTEQYNAEIQEPGYYDATDLKLPNYQQTKTPEYNIREYHESETDDDSSTVKHSEEYESARQSLGSSPTHLHYITDVKTINRITPVNETLDYRNDYELARPQEENLSAAQRLLNLAINDDTKTANRFNSKKLKMKRANTIDIPKPLNYYENDDESDDSILDRDDTTSSRRSNYLALRGPIRVGNNNKSTVPTFEPKTENDKKFMAFIQKHNNNSQNVSSIWLNKTNEPIKRASAEHNWSRKFGNIKTIFEKEENNSRPSSTTVSTAKQFWQSADDAVNAGKRSYVGPKVNKQGTRQLQSLFEQKQQESKLPWTSTEHNNVITGTLKVESNFKPIQNNQLIQGKNYKFIPQPLPVNKFSHAPMSAFKPPPKRCTPVQQVSQSFNYPNNSTNVKQQTYKNDGGNVSEPTTPLFLYTPKQPEFPATQPEDSKPAASAPWVNPSQGEHRVLSIATSKFENPSREISPQPPVRKVSKDKVQIPPILQQNNTIDHLYNPQKQYSDNNNLSAPYLVKNLQSNKSVRKLSGEYDNIAYNNKQPENIVTFKQPTPVKKPIIERNNSYTPVQMQQPQKPVQTVQNNVKKFNSTTPTNTTYNYSKPEIKVKPDHVNSYKNHEDISYMNDRNENHRPLTQPTPKLVLVQKPGRKASGEYDFTSHNESYKSQIPYQVENEVSEISQKSLKPLVFDFPDSECSSAATPDNLDEPTVTSPLTEYKAVSKVMTGPVSQQAVTVTQNTPKTRDDHDMARSLQKVLKNISSGEDLEDRKNQNHSLSPKQSYKSQNEQITPASSKNYQNTSSYSSKPQCTEDRIKSLKKPDTYAPHYKYSALENSKNIDQYDGHTNQIQQFSSKEISPKTQLKSKSPNPMYDSYSTQPLVRDRTPQSTNKIQAVAKPFSTESSLEINDEGESVVTTKLQIPVNRNVYYNNTDPNKVQQRLTIEQVEATNRRLSPQQLIKSDSWHKLAELPQPSLKPSPRASPKARNILQKAKSSHSLAVPKQFEAGLSRDEVEVKKKTVAAYFGGPISIGVSKFNNTTEENNSKTSINRKTTGQKITTQSKGTSLSRSRTMPEVTDLFEENLDVDEEFENIFRASIAK